MAEVAFYTIDTLSEIVRFVLLYLSVLFATYQRATRYCDGDGPSWAWSVKKVVDGLLIGAWILISVIKAAWECLDYFGFVFSVTVAQETGQSALWIMKRQSLQTASDSFVIIILASVIVGIIMIKRASASQETQDFVVRVLVSWILPTLAFRALWNIVVTAVLDTPELVTDQGAAAVSVADWIISGLGSAIIIATMIRLTQDAYWAIPTKLAAQSTSAPNQPGGESEIVEGEQGIMPEGPNVGPPLMSEM